MTGSATRSASASAAPASVAGKRGRAIRTESQRLLQLVPASLATVAKAVSACKATVGDWRPGTKIPSTDFRLALERAYSIPPDSWAVEPASDSPAATATAPAPSTQGGTPSALEDVEALLSSVRSQLARDGLLSAERVKLIESQTRLLGLKSKLEKDRETLEDSMVRQHPMIRSQWVRGWSG